MYTYIYTHRNSYKYIYIYIYVCVKIWKYAKDGGMYDCVPRGPHRFEVRRVILHRCLVSPVPWSFPGGATGKGLGLRV